MPVTKKAVKKENLKKRQKYDPRKAIEEAKKKEENAGEMTGKAAKSSAFPPDELLDNKNGKVEDRIRSKTS